MWIEILFLGCIILLFMWLGALSKSHENLTRRLDLCYRDVGDAFELISKQRKDIDALGNRLADKNELVRWCLRHRNVTFSQHIDTYVTVYYRDHRIGEIRREGIYTSDYGWTYNAYFVPNYEVDVPSVVIIQDVREFAVKYGHLLF